MLLTRPDNLKAEQHKLPSKLTAACPEMIQLAAGAKVFAPLLALQVDNADALMRWATQVPTCPTRTPCPRACRRTALTLCPGRR
ncbi:hypothetical protein K2224_16085 [Streptomyces sp. BHT-5-2]|nr:hypothetical protein K2224_16085 [Streptomyces sp. BHT-5-2]